MITTPLFLSALALFDQRLGPDARCLDQRAALRSTLILKLSPESWWARSWRPSGMAVVWRKDPPAPEDLVATAREYLGTPYSWGGLGDGGYDCSGFVNKVYAQNGYDLPRTSRDQFLVGTLVPPQLLRTGDLLFFVSEPGTERITHVAMYIADNEFIHAAMGKGEVTYDRLTSRYYAQRLRGAKRILDLPPGRYSNSDGSARVQGGSGGDEVATDTGGAAGTETTDNQTISSTTSTGSTEQPAEGDFVAQVIAENIESEHAPEERPPQLAAAIAKGVIAHVGPRLQRPDETGIGLRLGAGGFEGTATLVVAPELTYFDPESALHVALAAPFRMPVVENAPQLGEVTRQDWRTARDYSRVLQEVRFGQKESNLYLELGRTASGTLGHGQIMRSYTPNMASRSVPDFVLHPDALSLAFDGYLDRVGTETFIDDVVEPEVLGALVYVRPASFLGLENALARTLSVGLTYAVDATAPYHHPDGSLGDRPLHAAGVDAEIKLYRSESVDVKSYLDGSGLFHSGGAGAGGALGTLLRANLGSTRAHVLRARIEGKLSSSTFIPTYFDTTYRLSREQAPVDDVGATPMTKLDLLESLDGTPSRWGVYGELVYQMQRRISLGVGYEDGGATGSLPDEIRYVGRNLHLFVQMERLYLPRSSRSVDLYFAYHLRNFEKLAPLLGMKRANEYLFASASLNAWRYVSVGGSLRKGFSAEDGRAVVDGVLNMSVHYEL